MNREEGEIDPLFADRFRLGSRERTTPLATIYHAYDTHLDRPVRLTVGPRSTTGVDRATAERVFHAIAVAAIRAPAGPGLPVVWDAGRGRWDGENIVWIASATLSGDTVDRFARPPEISAPDWELRVLSAAEQLARILQHTHSAGIVHGAVSPASVTIADHGTSGVAVGLVDFGPQPELLQAHDRTARARKQRWSAWARACLYPAPELEAGEQPTARTDVYGFGVIIAALLARIQIREPGWDELLHPSETVDVGVELRRIADQAMKQRPAERQYSFLVVAEQLAAIRNAVHVDEAAPGAGAAELDRTLTAEPPAEFVSAIAWVARRVPAATLDWIPGVRPLAARTGFSLRRPLVSPKNGVAQPPGLAAYWAKRTQHAQRTAAAILAVLVVLVAGTTALGLNRPADGTAVAASAPTHATTGTAQPPYHASRMVAIPAILGTSQATAESSLTLVGLHLGAVSSINGPQAAGTVLGAAPGPGTHVAAATYVDLTVASGRAVIPTDLEGHSEHDVVTALHAAGFRPAVALTDSSHYASGYVLRVWPAPGTLAAAGSSIDITVARYRRPTHTPTTAPTRTPTSIPSDSRTSPAAPTDSPTSTPEATG
ncbi:PASTA domain-containing protein [Gryllotalpicola reticulitermitis]|uniref:PASTA domain-containing protein n=1 Tax=Gryllotalpicola reticulitermitis TaxID=1184153 RepID=A0ABV8QAC3_9MICO